LQAFQTIAQTIAHPRESQSRLRWSGAGLPRGLVLDGELVAFGDDGRPSFPLLSRRMLMRRPLIPAVLMIFDVLRV
jgi:hypothetical protein